MRIEYSKGYKYQLRRQAVFQTPIRPEEPAYTELVALMRSGLLIIKKYFAWDGCSGPTIDDRTNMRAGLCHDALYYLMRTGKLDLKWRPAADEMLEKLMIQDGASAFRARYYRFAVEKFAKSCATPENARDILIAP